MLELPDYVFEDSQSLLLWMEEILYYLIYPVPQELEYNGSHTTVQSKDPCNFKFP